MAILRGRSDRLLGRRWLNRRLVEGLALALPCMACARAHQPSDYQVKAAFLLNFTKFVEWPVAAFENARSPITICLLGDDPFEGSLDDLVKGESVGGRKLAVRRIRRAPPPKTCQVLFADRRGEEIYKIVSSIGAGVLTVGEGDSFLRDGGIIAFVAEGRHIRFDINQKAAADASLSISARLLNVARAVRK